MKTIILYFLPVLLTFSTLAQVPRIHTNNINGWFVYNGDHKFADKWGVHLEAQWRANDFITKKQQLFFRTGINYHCSPNLFVTVGYGFAETYPYGEFAVKAAFPEHRMYEQLQYKSVHGRFELVNRIRVEQRWSLLPTLQQGEYKPGDAVYQNRVRLNMKVSVPFRGKTIEDKSFYATANDEVFVSFGKHVGYNTFDQNRLFVGIGYKIPKIGKIEVGYMEQTLFKADGIKIENNHTFQFGLYSSLDFYKKNKT